jgi:hypothetical protein
VAHRASSTGTQTQFADPQASQQASEVCVSGFLSTDTDRAMFDCGGLDDLLDRPQHRRVHGSALICPIDRIPIGC